MNEQRVRDLIETLQTLDKDARIASPIEFKWNDKRTALLTIQESKAIAEIESAESEISDLKSEVEQLKRDLSKIESENDELKDENKEIKHKLGKISDALNF